MEVTRRSLSAAASSSASCCLALLPAQQPKMYAKTHEASSHAIASAPSVRMMIATDVGSTCAKEHTTPCKPSQARRACGLEEDAQCGGGGGYLAGGGVEAVAECLKVGGDLH